MLRGLLNALRHGMFLEVSKVFLSPSTGKAACDPQLVCPLVDHAPWYPKHLLQLSDTLRRAVIAFKDQLPPVLVQNVLPLGHSVFLFPVNQHHPHRSSVISFHLPYRSSSSHSSGSS